MKLVDVKLKPSTAYHPQTDGLTEHTNQTLETYLQAYCSYQQDDWVDYLPLAEFAFNNLVNSSMQQTPFFANLGYHPTFEPRITECSTVPAAANLAECLDIIHTELRAELKQAQETQAKYHDARAQPAPSFEEGDFVWLLRRNIKTTRPSDKLDYRHLGPFKVTSWKGKNAYHLCLPRSMSRLHPVFNVSLLEPYNGPAEKISPSCVDLDEDFAPEVAAILDSRKVGRRYEYLVSWKDLPTSENSWVPLSDLPISLNKIIERFHHRHPALPRPHHFDLNKDRSFPDSSNPVSNHSNSSLDVQTNFVDNSPPITETSNSSNIPSNSSNFIPDPVSSTSNTHSSPNLSSPNPPDPSPSPSPSPPAHSSRYCTPFAPKRAPLPPQPPRGAPYEPPTQTTMRSGCVSRPPPPRLDPEVPSRPCRAQPRKGDGVTAQIRVT